jgi:pimeloyl-ACP methyl ester carboxylesterase
LHGYTGSKDNWTRFAVNLTKDYHLVIPDIPGYGESSMVEEVSALGRSWGASAD